MGVSLVSHRDGPLQGTMGVCDLSSRSGVNVFRHRSEGCRKWKGLQQASGRRRWWGQEVPAVVLQCSFLFHQVISLTFGKFDLEPDTYCPYDSVSVFNGAVSDDAKRLGKFCGDTSPG